MVFSHDDCIRSPHDSDTRINQLHCKSSRWWSSHLTSRAWPAAALGLINDCKRRRSFIFEEPIRAHSRYRVFQRQWLKLEHWPRWRVLEVVGHPKRRQCYMENQKSAPGSIRLLKLQSGGKTAPKFGKSSWNIGLKQLASELRSGSRSDQYEPCWKLACRCCSWGWFDPHFRDGHRSRLRS